MLQQLSRWLAPAVLDRAVLALNHLLSSEAQAVSRLVPHAGRRVRLAIGGLPEVLQLPQAVSFRITPAGLLELDDGFGDAPADLYLEVDASRPGLLMESALHAGRPPVTVQGDAGLAADVGWLMDNLGWDVEDDLARLLGPAPAHELARVLRSAASGLKAVLATVSQAIAKRDGGDGLTGRST